MVGVENIYRSFLCGHSASTELCSNFVSENMCLVDGYSGNRVKEGSCSRQTFI